MTKEIYISTDIEANGPIPGEYSMLSLGSVALNEEGKILEKFYKKLQPLKNAKQHPQTMGFWEKNKGAYLEATSNPEPAEKIMNEYADWLDSLSKKNNKKLYFLAYPATWDFMFVSWYLIKFVKRYEENHFLDVPFHHQGIDIRTFAMAQLKKPYSESGIGSMPKSWTREESKNLMDHKAIDDALKQGLIFINMLKENRR
ncbi:MAG: 3'-5' exoribonuclease [Nanoarchaeota archaeon]|nr:3'-5' exoribonuclease [Nanoarchaeota archaeon]MBU0977494.1 3'-5' exoribonuclease [Nanoarchaeota archaeon]